MWRTPFESTHVAVYRMTCNCEIARWLVSPTSSKWKFIGCLNASLSASVLKHTHTHTSDSKCNQEKQFNFWWDEGRGESSVSIPPAKLRSFSIGLNKYIGGVYSLNTIQIGKYHYIIAVINFVSFQVENSIVYSYLFLFVSFQLIFRLGITIHTVEYRLEWLLAS